ncbi:hypothetical protein B0H11DRAFT_2286252, partial [Mycena galericulata]
MEHLRFKILLSRCMDRKILPEIGAIVVMTIDPVASLGQETLEDVEGNAACKKLVNEPSWERAGGLHQPFGVLFALVFPA